MGDITVKKKSVLLISVISSILLGIGITAFVVFNNAFSFSNLTVDIGDSDGLGIGKIADDNQTPSRRKRQSTENSQRETTYDKLITVDSEGNVDILRFYNNDGNTVEVPFHAILTEDYGDFIYAVFSDWSSEYQIYPGGGYPVEYAYWKSFQYYFYESYLTESGLSDSYQQFNYEFIALHKNSGKVFDLKESVIEKYAPSKALRGSIVYLQNGIAYTTKQNTSNNEVCLNRGLFDSITELIEITVVCSEVIGEFGYAQIALPNGEIKIGEQIINLNTFEVSPFDAIEDDYLKTMLYADTANIFYISSNKFVWLLGDYFYTLEYKDNSISTYRDNAPSIGVISNPFRSVYSSAPFLYIDKDKWINDDLLIIYEFFPNEIESNLKFSYENFVNEYYPDSSSYGKPLPDLYFKESKVYLVGSNFLDGAFLNKPFILEISIIQGTINKIFDSEGKGFYKSQQTRNPNFFLFGQEFYGSYPVATFVRTGNFHFFLQQGFVQTNFKFNIYTKEIYEESQSTPIFSYYDIKPIN